MSANHIKEESKVSPRKRGGAFRRFAGSLLDGSILSGERTENLLPFFFYLGALAIMLIFNTYYAEKKAREIDRMRQEITDLRIRYTSTKFKLMYHSNQSEIARQLSSQGFIESTVPPQNIPAHQKRRGWPALFGK